MNGKKFDEFLQDASVLITFGASLLLLAGWEKKKRSMKNGTGGVGATEGEYMIKAYWEDGRYGNVRVFAGWQYDDSGEKWARWNNPYARWSEFDDKIYKTRKGAEKAIQELIRLGENEWNGYPVTLSIITWDEYTQMLRR